MRTILSLASLLFLVPLASAGIGIPPVSLWGDHQVGPCDYWSGAYNVGDSYRLTCAVAGHSLYFHQGQAALVWECGYWIDGHDYYDCSGAPVALEL